MYWRILTLSLLSAGIIGCAAPRMRNTPLSQQELACTAYLDGLSSENDGVRNSMIFMVMQYCSRYPQEDVAPFLKCLRNISQKDTSPRNRLYAFIVHTYLQNPGLMKLAGEVPKGEDKKDEYFTQLYRIIEKRDFLVLR